MDSSSSTKPIGRVVVIVGTAAVFVASLLTMSPATAGWRGCVNAQEWARLDDGMTRHRVHEVFGTTGERDYVRRRESGHIIEKRSYRECRHSDVSGVAWIRFRDGHVYDGRFVGR